MKKLLLTIVGLASTLGVWSTTKQEQFPEAETVPDYYSVDLTQKNFKFFDTDLTNSNVVASLFPSITPTTQFNMGVGFLSSLDYTTYPAYADGIVCYSAGGFITNVPARNEGNITNFQKGVSLYDFGGQIGQVLVFNGNGSTLAESIKTLFDLEEAPSIPTASQNFGAILGFNWIQNKDIISQAANSNQNGTVRIRFEVNIFNPNDVETLNTISRVNDNNSAVTGGPAINSSSFRKYSNDFNKSETDLGTLIEGSWNPYRWMVYDIEFRREAGSDLDKSLSALKMQIPASALNGAAVLIRSIEMYFCPDNIEGIESNGKFTVTWNDYTPDDLEEEDPGQTPSGPKQKSEFFPEAEAIPSNFIDVTPKYYKFNDGNENWMDIFRTDIKSPAQTNFGSGSSISGNTNQGENWFTNESLANGNVIIQSGGYWNNVTPLLNGLSTFDFGGTIGNVFVLNGKNSNLNTAIKEISGHQNAYNIPKMEVNFQNLQWMWILDHVGMKANNVTNTSNNTLRVRMEVNVYNNDMETDSQIFSDMVYQTETATATTLTKVDDLRLDEFTYRTGDKNSSADTDYDATKTSEWNPNRWMVIDFEVPYNGVASYVRIPILNNVMSPYNDGALLIRNIEIYGIPSSILASGTAVKSWNEYTMEVSEPTFDEYAETPAGKSIENAETAGETIEDESFNGFQDTAKNTWTAENATVTGNYYYSETEGKNKNLADGDVELSDNTLTIHAPSDLGSELHYGIVKINTGIKLSGDKSYNFSCQAFQKTRAQEDAPNVLINVTSDGTGAKTGLANKTTDGITHYASNVTLPEGNLVLEVHYGGNAGKDIILSNITFAVNGETEDNPSVDPTPTDPEPEETFSAGVPVNRAMSFASEGTINCGAMPELNNLSSYSIQFWIKPTTWNEGAVLMHRGDSFSVELGDNNTVVFRNNNNTVTAKGFTPGEWNQVTLICNNGNANVLIDGEIAGEGTLGSLEDTKRAFILGGNYTGLIDEVRIWDDALNDMMKRFDYFIFNTINKWNPMWENLVAYYKMDQEVAPQMIEYKVLETKKEDGTNNHGVFSETGVSRVVANNDKLPYLVNAAYTENARFYDRLIPKDAYLLSNEIIILGADCVAADGSIALRTPNNHGTVYGGVDYVDEYGKRSGVAYFDGQTGSYIEAPAASIHPYRPAANQDLENTSYNLYEFMTRVNIDKWQPGAYLLRKENDAKTSGLAIYLGETPNTLVIRVDGKTNTSNEITNFKLGDWNQLTIYTNESSRSASSKYYFYVNGTEVKFAAANSAIEMTSLEAVKDLPVRIGEGFEGYMDETYLTNEILGSSVMSTYINKGVILPTVEQGRNLAEMAGTGFLFNYDDEEDLGYSSFSQDYIADYIRSLYNGYNAPKIVLSVRGFGSADNPGNDSEFNLIMNDAGKRQVFAQQLAEASGHYDGVELDFEWVYDATGWKNYHQLSEAIISALPEGKSFRISTHNVTYEYPLEGINNDGIDGFTFQMYGPNYNQNHMSYNYFEQMIQSFIKYGYPKDKIMSSFSTTTSKSSGGADITGIRTAGFYDSYVLPEPGKENDVDIANDRKFMSPMQVYKRAKYTREQNLQGIFYWDMGNDYWLGSKNMGTGGVAYYEGMPEFNGAKYCSYGINSNIDKAVKSAAFNHPDTEVVPGEEIEIPDLDDDYVQDDDNHNGTTEIDSLNEVEYVDVYSISGMLVKRHVNKAEIQNVLEKGLYIVDRQKVIVK